MEKETVSYEKVMALIAETWELFRQNQKENQALVRRLEAERLQREAQMEKERKEREAQMEKERKERERERKEWEKNWDKALAATNKKIAEITDVLGLFAEEQVAPAVLKLFSQFNWDLREVMHHVKVTDERRQIVAEVDLLLVNDTVSVAVEVKNRLRKDDIDEHLQRLETMKKYPSRAFADTRLYGAIAAMVAEPSLVNYALKKGLCVIVPSGESVDMRVPPDYPKRYTEIGPRRPAEIPTSES